MTPTALPHLFDAPPDPDRHADFYDGIAGKRFAAWVIDVALIWVLTAVAVVLSAFLLLWLLPGVYLTLSVAYRFVTLAGGSATPGMRLMAVEVRDHRGRPLGSGTALAHVIGHTLSMSFVLPQILSVASILTTDRRQSLTDHVLGTVVINRPARH